MLGIKIKQLFESSFNKVYKWTVNNLSLITTGLQVHILQTVFTLLEAMLPALQPQQDGVTEVERPPEDSDEEDEPRSVTDIQQTYIFALVWAFGGYLENDERVRLEAYLRYSTGTVQYSTVQYYLREKIQLQFPQLPKGESIYNFSVREGIKDRKIKCNIKGVWG